MLAERIYRQTNRLYDRARSPTAVDAARAQPTGGIDQLRGHRYCVLVSYRRDGTPVPHRCGSGSQTGGCMSAPAPPRPSCSASAATSRCGSPHRRCGERRWVLRSWARRASSTPPRSDTPSERSALTTGGCAASIFAC